MCLFKRSIENHRVRGMCACVTDDKGGLVEVGLFICFILTSGLHTVHCTNDVEICLFSFSSQAVNRMLHVSFNWSFFT